MNTKIKGRFTADGNNKVLNLGVEVQTFHVINKTQAHGTTDGNGYEFEWTDDMGTALYQTLHPAANTTAANNFVATGITQIDSFNYAVGAKVVVTTSTNAVQPVYTVASSAKLKTGSIVRLVGTDQRNLRGLDFSVDDIDNGGTNFRLKNELATAPGIEAGTGHYRIVAPNREVYDTVFPAKRIISKISQEASAIVTCLVDHGFSVGQLVRINVPNHSQMVEMHGLEGKVTAVTAGTFTLNIDSSAFTAFVFPIYTVNEFTPASVIPIGDTLTLGYDGATRNSAFRGVVLDAGVNAPAGSADDDIYWVAEKAAELVE